jgi:hypothetical protein
MAYSVFRVPNGITASPTGVAQVVSVVQAFSGGGQTADLQQWQNHLGTVLAEVDSAGNFSGVAGIFAGDIAVNGGDITTTSGTFNVANSTTTLNLGTASTNVYVGSVGTTNVNTLTATGQINANNGTIATNQTSATLFASPTTVNAFAAATTLNLATTAANSAITIGSSTSTTTIGGNLIVNGTTTTVNSTTINIDDLNLNLASDSGTLATVDGGGITVGSGLGITMNYDHANTSWTSSQNFNIATTKTYKIAGTDVLNATGIGAGVILSSLQRVGTIATGVWNGSVIGTGYTTAQVTAVTAGATNTISVTGTTQAPFINLATVGTPVTTSFVKITTDVYGRVTATTAVASGDIPNHSAAQITAGTLAVAQGGTNLASYAVGDLLYASATTTIAKLAAVASGQFLVSNGVTTAPSYRSLSTPDITGALGYTPANSGSVLSGTGSSGRLTLWNGTSTLTSDAELLYDSANNILTIGSGNISATTTDVTVSNTPGSPTAIDTFATGVYRAAKYLITARSANGDTYQVSEALVTYHPTGNAFVSEYGQIYTQGAAPLITLGADITGGNVRLTAYGPSSPTVRLMRLAITF